MADETNSSNNNDVENPPVVDDDDDDDRTHYEVLGIDYPKKATLLDIKKAYKKKAMLHHPDRVEPGARQTATVEFQKIRDAFEVLSNIRQRALYDLDLESGRKTRGRRDESRKSSSGNGEGGGTWSHPNSSRNSSQNSSRSGGARDASNKYNGPGRNERREKRKAKREASAKSDYANDWNNLNNENITKLGSDATCKCRREVSWANVAKAGVLTVAVVLLVVLI